MSFKVIRGVFSLFLFALFYFGLVPTFFASASQLTDETFDSNLAQAKGKNWLALMSQDAKHSTDIEIVTQNNFPSRVIPVDPNKDWREVDWKDPFAPKMLTSEATKSKADIVITLEQNVPPPLTPEASVDKLMDPFAPRNEAPELSDPFEAYNRFMFSFNEGVYEHVLEPVAENYRDVVNEDIRMVIGNVFDNAMAPVRLVSSFLQGDVDKTGRVIGRTIINTTLGIGGLFDVAEIFGIESVNEDLDQTLGSYGVPNGPYIMLPLLGPTTFRGIVGKAGGSFLSPTFHFVPSFEIAAGLTMTDKINDASFMLDDKKQLEESTVDEYESMKDFYNQYRFGLVNE